MPKPVALTRPEWPKPLVAGVSDKKMEDGKMVKKIGIVLTDPVGLGKWHKNTQIVLAVCARLGIIPIKPEGCRDYIVSCEDAKAIQEYFDRKVGVAK